MDDLFLKCVNQIEFGVIVVDSRLTIKAWNHYMERISGFRRKDVAGKNLPEVCSVFSFPQYRRILDQAVQKQMPRFCSSRLHKAFIYTKNGYDATTRQNMMVVPILTSGEPYVLIQINDITYQVNNERKLTSLLREMTDGYNEVKESEEFNKRLAVTDPLTGLYNRAALRDQVSRIMGNESGSRDYALVFLDLDGFKMVNDTYGHTIGDKLLIKISDRLRLCVRSEDFVARFGGDEFVVLIAVRSGRVSAEVVAKKLNAEIAKPVVIDGNLFRITGSLGVALLEESADAEDLMNKADSAMYHSKKMGKNTYTFYSDIQN